MHIGAASRMKQDSYLSRWRVGWCPFCVIFEGKAYLPLQTLCPDLLSPVLDHQFYGSLESNRAGLQQGKDFIILRWAHSLTHHVSWCTKRWRHHFDDKDPYSQSYSFSSSFIRMWELDHKEGWMLENWCFWIVVLEKTLVCPLDCKEIKLVNPEGNQSWTFIGRTDAEAEAQILWPPEVNSWLIGKDPDPGKDWGQEEKGMTED